MAGIRPARTMRTMLSQSWSRFSRKKPKKSYVKAMPHTSLLVFNMGKENPEFTLHMSLVSQQPIQIRSNSLESARLTCNKYLEANIPEGYQFKILVYPHNVIREHKIGFRRRSGPYLQGNGPLVREAGLHSCQDKAEPADIRGQDQA